MISGDSFVEVAEYMTLFCGISHQGIGKQQRQWPRVETHNSFCGVVVVVKILRDWRIYHENHVRYGRSVPSVLLI